MVIRTVSYISCFLLIYSTTKYSLCDLDVSAGSPSNSNLEGENDPDQDFEIISEHEIDSRHVNPPKEQPPNIGSIHIKTTIRLRYARTRVMARVSNPSETTSQMVNFTIRIPQEAFISRFEMRLDNSPKIYKAIAVKAGQGKRLFQFAANESRSVTIGIIEESEDEFNEVIFRFIIGAKRSIVTSLMYDERLPRIEGRYDAVINFIPHQISSQTHFKIEVVIEENLRIQDLQVYMDEKLAKKNSAKIIQRPTTPTKARITWDNADAWEPPDEFIVSYELERESSTGHVLVRNGYFVHFFVPEQEEVLRKHVVFVLDISDSMFGLKFNQTLTAMVDILDELKPDDFFNIIAFSNEATVWSCFHGSESKRRIPFPADAQCKDEARHFIKTVTLYGSTNIYSALSDALDLIKTVTFDPTEPDINSQQMNARFRYRKILGRPASLNEKLPDGVKSLIIFLTDGEPTSGIIDKNTILSRVAALNQNLSVPIFSLAFGESPDFAFLTKISTSNGAFARKIFEKADASVQLTDFYREISSPVLANVTFTYETPEGVYLTEIVKPRQSMAFEGQEILSSGRIKLNSSVSSNISITTVSVTASGRNGKLTQIVPIKICDNLVGSCPTDGTEFDDKRIEKLFVYLSLKRMMDDFYILDSERLVSDESQLQIEADKLRERIEQTALEYGLVTRFTSMVMRTKSLREEEMDRVDELPEIEVFLENAKPLPQPKGVVYKHFNIESKKYEYLSPNQKRSMDMENTCLKGLTEVHVGNGTGLKISKIPIGSAVKTKVGL